MAPCRVRPPPRPRASRTVVVRARDAKVTNHSSDAFSRCFEGCVRPTDRNFVCKHASHRGGLRRRQCATTTTTVRDDDDDDDDEDVTTNHSDLDDDDDDDDDDRDRDRGDVVERRHETRVR